MSGNDPPVGAVVEVPAGRGIVRFSGATEFAVGKWIGIELSEPKGKNDGSVKDVEYFKCPMLHGVFVRPSQVKIISRGLSTSVSVSRTSFSTITITMIFKIDESCHDCSPSTRTYAYSE